MPRKSSIETLPKDILGQLNQWIGDGKLTIDELTEYLERQGHPRGRSAVGLHAKKINAMRRRLKESREIANALVAEIGDDLTSSKQGRMIVEILRNLVFDHLAKKMEDDEDVDPQAFFFLAKSIKDLASANRLDQDYEKKVREQAEKEAREKAADVAKKVATEGGLSEETAEQIRNQILGTA